jgi:hypothetical protein
MKKNKNFEIQLGQKWLLPLLLMLSFTPVCAQSMSVVPSGGSGQDQTFTVYATAPMGNVEQVWLLLADPQCQVTVIYNGGNQQLYIMGDSGWISGTGSNSVCQLNGGGFNNGGSSVSASFSLHFFLPAYAGLKTIYSAFSYNGGTIYGWYPEGVWTPNPVNPPSITGSILGSGTSNTFTFSSQTSNYDGANTPSTIQQMYLRLTDDSGGQCQVTVANVQGAQALYLVDSSNSYWLGPISPGSGSLSNTYCQLNGSGSGASGSSSATANFSITFLSGFSAGNKNIYAAAIDSAGADSGWTWIGYWTIPVSFSMSAAPASTVVAPGGSAVYQISVSAPPGTTVSLSASLPPLVVTLSPSSITGNGSSTLLVTAPQGTPVGNYGVTVFGTSGGVQHTVTVILIVADFTITVGGQSPAAINPGDTARYLVSISNPQLLSITLSTTGLPTGASATFSPPSLTGTGDSLMTVTTSSSLGRSLYSFTVTGQSTVISHSATASLNVPSKPIITGPNGSSSVAFWYLGGKPSVDGYYVQWPVYYQAGYDIHLTAVVDGISSDAFPVFIDTPFTMTTSSPGQFCVGGVCECALYPREGPVGYANYVNHSISDLLGLALVPIRLKESLEKQQWSTPPTARTPPEIQKQLRGM